MSVYFIVKARVKYFICLPSDVANAWVVLSLIKKIRSKVSPLSLSEKNENARKFAIPTNVFFLGKREHSASLFIK
jgi:hypothetical protein